MWGFIFGGMAVGAIVSVWFLWTRFQKFGIVQKLAGERKWLRRLLALAPLILLGVFAIISPVNAVIVMVHMAVYWALAELIALIIRKIRNRKKAGTENQDTAKDQRAGRFYWVGGVVLCFELCYFSIASFQAFHVWEKDYQLETTKSLGKEKLRVALIADSHMGTTFDGDGFAEKLKMIQETHPDILVIAGDFVDDDSTRDDLYRSCEALKEFEAPLGKYFVYGNHDKGYYRKRDFSIDDFEAVLEDYAGVQILTDEVTMASDSVYIVGRKDRSDKSRIEIDKILSLLDPSRYIIVLDHQPTDYDAEAAAGADLVLSGHTHGGQMLEINLIGQLIGANDQTYGLEKRGNTDFIVTSGISDWTIWFKTGTRSEFCVIDITQK